MSSRTVHRTAASIASANAWPGLERPRPEVAVGQADERRGRRRGRPTGTCPLRRSDRTSPGCCAAPSSAAACHRGAPSRAPSRTGRSGRRRADPGEARERDGRRGRDVPGRASVGRRSSRANAARSASGPSSPADGRSDEPSCRSSRAARGHARAAPSSNDAPARSATQRPEQVEARVRVDPSRPGAARVASPSNGSPEAWASRCAPSSPADRPVRRGRGARASAAMSTASAVTGFVTDAQRYGGRRRRASPTMPPGRRARRRRGRRPRRRSRRARCRGPQSWLLAVPGADTSGRPWPVRRAGQGCRGGCIMRR